jgi:hypothetical protein
MCDSICALRLVASSFPFVSISSTRMLELRVCVCARARAAVGMRVGERECNSVECVCVYECVYMCIYKGMYVYLD